MLGARRESSLVGCCSIQSKPRFAPDTRLMRTPHIYGEFALSLGKQSPYILSKFNPLDTDTPLIRTLSMVPSVSVLTEFDCTLYFTLYWDDDYAGSTVQHDPMNHPSFLALSYFLIVPSG